MKLLAISALLIICCLSLTQGEVPCKQFVKEVMYKQLKQFVDCKKELNFKSEEDKLSKMNCILKCAMTKVGVLTADGYVDEASALAYVEKEIPEKLQAKALELMTKCAEKTDGIDPEEPTCKTYNPLIKCAMAVLFKICEE